jgi:hypothetical protein
MAPRAAALVEAIARATGSAEGLAEEVAALAAAGQASSSAPVDTPPVVTPVAVPPAPGPVAGDASMEPARVERALPAPGEPGPDAGAEAETAAAAMFGLEAEPEALSETETDTGMAAAAAISDAAPGDGDRDVASASAADAGASAATAPSFARLRARGGARAGERAWFLPTLAAGLGLLLVLQWLLADRARLAADPRWRPLVSRVCGVLRCHVPPWREPSAFALLERDVRPHPRLSDALQVTASFRNDAPWPQAWPELLLTLSDVDGRTVGSRAFVAGEYLGSQPRDRLIASGQTATVRLEIREPRPRSVAFAFDFR